MRRGDQRGRIGSGRCAQILVQGHEREDARDTGEEHGGFKGAGGDEAERHGLVLSLDHRIQRDGGADAGEGDDDLEEGAPERAGVGAGADEEVCACYRAVEPVGGQVWESRQR